MNHLGLHAITFRVELDEFRDFDFIFDDEDVVIRHEYSSPDESSAGGTSSLMAAVVCLKSKALNHEHVKKRCD